VEILLKPKFKNFDGEITIYAYESGMSSGSGAPSGIIASGTGSGETGSGGGNPTGSGTGQANP
jgi:hypothetical protein